MKNIVEQIQNEAKEIFSTAKGSHDFDHTERVYCLAVHIAKKEKADLLIVQIATLLHDIAREEQDESGGKICHAEKGAERAKELLQKYDLTPAQINHIASCIATHRFRKNLPPASLEAKILYDADKLDAIGAIGIGRAFVFSGEVGARVHATDLVIDETNLYTKSDTAYHEFEIKLKRIKDKILTNEGKRIAEHRHKFMVEFFDELKDEVIGNK
jgi:uncharacterized protein